jgi:hypothetical protein
MSDRFALKANSRDLCRIYGLPLEGGVVPWGALPLEYRA